MIRFLFILFFTIPLLAQRGDFYDTYDYNMKNYRGAESISDENYKEYELPPKFKKPALVSPKNVQIPSDFNSLIQGPIGIRRSTNQAQNPTAQTDKLLINPITGTVNLNAITKQREKEKASKEKKEQFLKREIEPYTETRSRRMEIIFLTTLPFAAALSVGITTLLGNAKGNPLLFQKHFIKSTPGFAFVFLLTTAFSATNMISDINYYDEYMKNKKENNVDMPGIGHQSQLHKVEYMIHFSFELGSKNF